LPTVGGERERRTSRLGGGGFKVRASPTDRRKAYARRKGHGLAARAANVGMQNVPMLAIGAIQNAAPVATLAPANPLHRRTPLPIIRTFRRFGVFRKFRKYVSQPNLRNITGAPSGVFSFAPPFIGVRNIT